MVFSMFDASMFSPVDGQGLMVVDLALELHRRAKVGLRDPWIGGNGKTLKKYGLAIG